MVAQKVAQRAERRAVSMVAHSAVAKVRQQAVLKADTTGCSQAALKDSAKVALMVASMAQQEVEKRADYSVDGTAGPWVVWRVALMVERRVLAMVD